MVQIHKHFQEIEDIELFCVEGGYGSGCQRYGVPCHRLPIGVI